MFSACPCCGRLAEAKPALTAKVLRFAVTLLSSEKWLQICGLVPVAAPPPCSGEGELLPENNIAGAGPASYCVSRGRNGLLNPVPEGRSGLLWAQALCSSCEFTQSGLSRSPASPCGSAQGCRPCVSVPGRAQHAAYLPMLPLSFWTGPAEQRAVFGLRGSGWSLRNHLLGPALPTALPAKERGLAEQKWLSGPCCVLVLPENRVAKNYRATWWSC